jgi:hypothetical protein
MAPREDNSKKISPVPGGVGGLLQRQAGLLSPLERFQQILGLVPTGYAQDRLTP